MNAFICLLSFLSQNDVPFFVVPLSKSQIGLNSVAVVFGMYGKGLRKSVKLASFYVATSRWFFGRRFHVRRVVGTFDDGQGTGGWQVVIGATVPLTSERHFACTGKELLGFLAARIQDGYEPITTLSFEYVAESVIPVSREVPVLKNK